MISKDTNQKKIDNQQNSENKIPLKNQSKLENEQQQSNETFLKSEIIQGKPFTINSILSTKSHKQQKKQKLKIQFLDQLVQKNSSSESQEQEEEKYQYEGEEQKLNQRERQIQKSYSSSSDQQEEEIQLKFQNLKLIDTVVPHSENDSSYSNQDDNIQLENNNQKTEIQTQNQYNQKIKGFQSPNSAKIQFGGQQYLNEQNSQIYEYDSEEVPIRSILKKQEYKDFKNLKNIDGKTIPKHSKSNSRAFSTTISDKSDDQIYINQNKINDFSKIEAYFKGNDLENSLLTSQKQKIRNLYPLKSMLKNSPSQIPSTFNNLKKIEGKINRRKFSNESSSEESQGNIHFAEDILLDENFYQYQYDPQEQPERPILKRNSCLIQNNILNLDILQQNNNQYKSPTNFQYDKNNSNLNNNCNFNNLTEKQDSFQQDLQFQQKRNNSKKKSFKFSKLKNIEGKILTRSGSLNIENNDNTQDFSKSEDSNQNQDFNDDDYDNEKEDENEDEGDGKGDEYQLKQNIKSKLKTKKFQKKQKKCYKKANSENNKSRNQKSYLQSECGSKQSDVQFIGVEELNQLHQYKSNQAPKKTILLKRRKSLDLRKLKKINNDKIDGKVIRRRSLYTTEEKAVHFGCTIPAEPTSPKSIKNYSSIRKLNSLDSDNKSDNDKENLSQYFSNSMFLLNDQSSHISKSQNVGHDPENQYQQLQKKPILKNKDQSAQQIQKKSQNKFFQKVDKFQQEYLENMQGLLEMIEPQTIPDYFSDQNSLSSNYLNTFLQVLKLKLIDTIEINPPLSILNYKQEKTNKKTKQVILAPFENFQNPDPKFQQKCVCHIQGKIKYDSDTENYIENYNKQNIKSQPIASMHTSIQNKKDLNEYINQNQNENKHESNLKNQTFQTKNQLKNKKKCVFCVQRQKQQQQNDLQQQQFLSLQQQTPNLEEINRINEQKKYWDSIYFVKDYIQGFSKLSYFEDIITDQSSNDLLEIINLLKKVNSISEDEYSELYRLC